MSGLALVFGGALRARPGARGARRPHRHRVWLDGVFEGGARERNRAAAAAAGAAARVAGKPRRSRASKGVRKVGARASSHAAPRFS